MGEHLQVDMVQVGVDTLEALVVEIFITQQEEVHISTQTQRMSLNK